MKKHLMLLSLLLVFLAFSNSCKKDSDEPEVKEFKEDFFDVTKLWAKGWIIRDNSSPYSAGWMQGFTGADKSGRPGFGAHSYKTEEDEYAYAGYLSWGTDPIPISSWMISPVYQIKNGDKLIFYTRSAGIRGYVDRLQVRLNEMDDTSDIGNTAGSVGKFTLLLKDINEAAAVDGYPGSWTKYEITISGLSGPKNTRIAFRYFVDGTKSSAIGVDSFSLTNF